MKFRKRPLEIEAIQWKERNSEEAKAFAGDYLLNKPNGFAVMTKEGVMAGKLNDWIIRGVEGEFYICDAQIFEKTYEPVIE